MRKITKSQRAVQVKAYRLANELREYLPDLVEAVHCMRLRARAESGDIGPEAWTAALESITAFDLAQHLRRAWLLDPLPESARTATRPVPEAVE